MAIALGLQGLFRYVHLDWDQSLHLYKKLVKGNWIQEFSRAIDIYTGKIKGFKDVPEDQYMREETLKGDLKIRIRNIITVELERWAGISTGVEKAKPVAPKVVQKPAPVVEDDNPYADNPYAPTHSP